MNSSKLKLLFILFFLLTDIFFIFRLKEVIESKNYFTETEISEAVEYINSKGVNIASETVIQQKNVPQVLKLTFGNNAIEKLAREIMNGGIGTFKVPDGYSFVGENESFSFFHDYSFEYTKPSYSVTSEGVESVLEFAESVHDSVNSKLAEIFEKPVNKLLPDGIRITVNIKKHMSSNGLDYILATQCINGYEIDGAQISAVFRGDEIVYTKGKLYFTDNITEYSTNAYDSINILFELDESETEITKMELLYFPVFESQTSYYLSPAYKLTYADGSTQLYDATSGTKRK